MKGRLRLIKAKGKTDVEVYKRVNLDRKLFSKIRIGKGHIPSKRTVVALAISLELNLDEIDDLLEWAGYALSHSQKFDVIVEYFIVSGNYDIFGYNSMLAKQRAIEGECHITTVLFDNNYELLHDRIDIRAVGSITERDYFVGGSTALLDAIGRTLHKMSNVQKHTADDYRAEKVLFVIITDGAENSSREYSAAKVKALIERQKTKFSWEFILLGANIDAVETTGRFGIGPDRAIDYLADSAGTELNFNVMASAVATFREVGTVDEACFEEIRKDVKRRGVRK